jgi:hypothetical protein
MTREEYDALVEDWTRHSSDPAAYFCSPPMVDIIAVKR